MLSLKSVAMLAAALTLCGCSTATWVKLPKDSTLIVNERPTHFKEGLVKTRAFSWSTTAGIPYRVEDSQSHVIHNGKLKAGFRVRAVFWPPMSFTIWPMGFAQRCYDLTGASPQACTHQDMVDLRRNRRLYH